MYKWIEITRYRWNKENFDDYINIRWALTLFLEAKYLATHTPILVDEILSIARTYRGVHIKFKYRFAVGFND